MLATSHVREQQHCRAAGFLSVCFSPTARGLFVCVEIVRAASTPKRGVRWGELVATHVQHTMVRECGQLHAGGRPRVPDWLNLSFAACRMVHADHGGSCV